MRRCLRGRPRRAATAVVLALVPIAVVGCGGHDPTRADVVARGDAICFNAQQTLRSLTPPAAGDTRALAAYLHRVAHTISAEASMLRALPRPSQRQATLDRFLSAMHDSAASYRTAAAAATADDPNRVADALARLRASPAAAYARTYGLKQCANAEIAQQ